MIIQKRGILPAIAFAAGIGLAFSSSAQTAVNLFGTATPHTAVGTDTNTVTFPSAEKSRC